MRIATAIRTSVKWGGAALAIVLLVVWIGSGWWFVSSPRIGRHVLAVTDGSLMDYHFLNSVTGGFARFVMDSARGPFRWWFEYVELPNAAVCIIPLWAPLRFTLIVTGFAWRADLIARRRAMLGKCPNCGYARAGLAAGALCPQCGTSPVAA